MPEANMGYLKEAKLTRQWSLRICMAAIINKKC